MNVLSDDELADLERLAERDDLECSKWAKRLLDVANGENNAR